MQGLLRLWEAEIAFSRLALASLHTHSEPELERTGPVAGVVEQLQKIRYRSYDAWTYVTNISHLVYGTTFIDTFLSDTTLFLFLLHPRSMGKNQQISLQMLLDASSRADALTRLALKRTREIGFLGFPDRIDMLRQTFGLDIAITGPDSEALAHYTSIRNSVIHDQGVFELVYDESGAVTTRQKDMSSTSHSRRVKGYYPCYRQL